MLIERRSIIKSKLKLILAVILLFLSFLTYILYQSSSLKLNVTPRGDEVAYLESAIDVHDQGGPSFLIRGMFSGQFKEANRHPLYLGMLSIVAQRDLAFYAHAKALNFFLGLTLLLIFVLVAYSQVGLVLAAILTSLLATNYFVIDQFAKVSVEPLLMIFCLLVWYWMLKGIKTTKQAFILGILVGFAYLSKITAVFLFPAAILSVIYDESLGIKLKNYFPLKNQIAKLLIAFSIGAVLIMFPLLWRNSLVYHNPFYNENSKYAFIKSGDERRLVNVINSTTLVNTLSPAEIVTRIKLSLMGTVVVLGQLIFSFHRIRGGLLIILLLSLSYYFDKNRRRSLISLFTIIPFLVFYVWYYPVSSHYRYILPIYPVIIINLALLLMYLLNRKARLGDLLLIILLTATVVYSFNFSHKLYEQYGFSSPWKIIDPNARYEQVLTWITRQLPPNEKYFNGPGHDFQIEWLANTDHQQLEVPYLSSFEEFMQYAQENNVKYLILTKALVNYRQEIFGEYFDSQERKGVIIKKVPTQFVQKYLDTNEKRIEYIIYEISL